MTKTAAPQLYRLFLIEGLPEPLTPASSHLQLFDNYIDHTRLRLRKIRDPYSKLWTFALQQHIHAAEGEMPRLAEIHLNDTEHAQFEHFEGREIRKNRYFHEFDQVVITFDVYLGRLFGLNTARVDLDTIAELSDYLPPPFAVLEVTGDTFFDGNVLVDQTFEEVRAHVATKSQIPTPST